MSLSRAWQALGHLRQLTLHQRLQRFGLFRGRCSRGDYQGLHGLQQVFDIVREARAGLVNRLGVGVLLQLLFAQLGLVKIAQQLRQQARMDLQRGRNRAGCTIELQPVISETEHMRGLRAKLLLPLAVAQLPPASQGSSSRLATAARMNASGSPWYSAWRARSLYPLFKRQADG